MCKMIFLSGWIFMLSLFICSCKNSSNLNNQKTNEDSTAAVSDKGATAGPPAIIYKTRGDYYDKVPVTLSEDKTKVVSYPGVKDVFFKGELAYPTRLNDGFLLDNRGVDVNTAFLSLTYEEYRKLDETPTKEELYGMILDKDPLTEIYNCGSRYNYKDIVNELNNRIDEKKLDTFNKLK